MTAQNSTASLRSDPLIQLTFGPYMIHSYVFSVSLSTVSISLSIDWTPENIAHLRFQKYVCLKYYILKKKIQACIHK